MQAITLQPKLHEQGGMIGSGSRLGIALDARPAHEMTFRISR
jgi:hypothetical protein